MVAFASKVLPVGPQPILDGSGPVRRATYMTFYLCLLFLTDDFYGRLNRDIRVMSSRPTSSVLFQQ
jgi:hypothetical protein